MGPLLVAIATLIYKGEDPPRIRCACVNKTVFHLYKIDDTTSHPTNQISILFLAELSHDEGTTRVARLSITCRQSQHESKSRYHHGRGAYSLVRARGSKCCDSRVSCSVLALPRALCRPSLHVSASRSIKLIQSLNHQRRIRRRHRRPPSQDMALVPARRTSQNTTNIQTSPKSALFSLARPKGPHQTQPVLFEILVTPPPNLSGKRPGA